LYYDPILDVHHKLPVMVAVINALYLAPQRPSDAQRLYEAGLAMIGALGDGPPNVIGERNTGVALLLAREWDDAETATRLAAAAEASYEPTYDTRRGEFTWGFGLNEEYPRGQFNAIMAAAEAMTPGAWTALATDGPRPISPGEVVGVDFPTVAMRRAEWHNDELHLMTAPRDDGVVGQPTSWRVTGLDDPTRWKATAAGVPLDTRVHNGELVIDTVVGAHPYSVSRLSV
jgi:hypothetical protein